MPGVPALSCAALTLGMCTQDSVNHWNCCCCWCLVLIPPAVQQVGGCSARGSVGGSSEQIWFVPFSGWDAIANSELLFYGEMLPGFPLLVWLLQARGKLYEAVPGRALSAKQLLGCAALPAELRYSLCVVPEAASTHKMYLSPAAQTAPVWVAVPF